MWQITSSEGSTQLFSSDHSQSRARARLGVKAVLGQGQAWGYGSARPPSASSGAPRGCSALLRRLRLGAPGRAAPRSIAWHPHSHLHTCTPAPGHSQPGTPARFLMDAHLRALLLIVQPLGALLRRGVGLGVEHFFERRSGDRTRVDGVCDFEKVPPDQLCPSTKSRVRE